VQSNEFKRVKNKKKFFQEKAEKIFLNQKLFKEI